MRDPLNSFIVMIYLLFLDPGIVRDDGMSHAELGIVSVPSANPNITLN